MDYGLWRDRVQGSIEYYQKNTYDLLFGRPLVLSSGIPSVDENIGNLRNSGIEFSINTVNVRTKNLTWKTGFNISTVANEIIKLPQERVKNGAFQLEVGRSLFDFHIREFAGVDPQDGAAQWYQNVLDAAGTPTGERKTTKVYGNATDYYQGTAIPKWLGGISSNLTYKNFDLAVLLNFSGGNKILDDDYSNLMHGFTSGYGSQLHRDILNRWQKPGDVTDVPILDPNITDIVQRSTRYLVSGDYVRLRNVTLGYTVKLPWKSVRNLRVYAQADNFLTWTKGRKGLDPETTNAQGIPNGTTNNNSSVFKTLSGGINVSF